MNSPAGAGLLGGASIRSRSARRPHAPKRLRWLAIVGALSVLILGVGWLWLRDSSLVSVKTVSVSGLTGPNAATMRDRLIAAAKKMTTLNLSQSKLEQSIGDFPYVQSVRATPDYPHGVSIAVDETVPIALVVTPTGTATVDTDGRILNSSVTVASALPSLKASGLPTGKFLTEADTIDEIRVLAGAPYALIAHVQTVTISVAHGLTVKLRNGPVLYFGDASDPVAQWKAAVAVLADPSSQGASYIDVTNSDRPAAG